MPATEEPYRQQRTLHVVFAVTSIGMMLSTVWMILADHLRPWKEVQREFHRVETDKLKVAETQKLEEQKAKHQAELQKIDAEIAAAEAKEGENYRRIRSIEGELKRLKGEFERLDTKKRFEKAELDSKRSFYDGMIHNDDERQARAFITSTIAPLEEQLIASTREFEAAQVKVQMKEAELSELRGNVEDKKKRREDLTREVDRVSRLLEQKESQYFGLFSGLRGMPIIDLAAPPTKIAQISLPELTINYNFKDVPRYDRCTTCHMGIDRIGYDTAADGKPMKDHPDHPEWRAFASHPSLTTGATTVDPSGKTVNAGLYLDANGPHPINSFGCTVCHGGQGSGTDFTYASHTPTSLHQREEWEKDHHWHEMHHWDEPMLPARFLQSSCIKCHHQVTDVPQADKLQAGYQRIVKYGCTGCHTIGGEGSFGPDLTDTRQVGPNLKHLGSKVSKDWALRWIKNPHSFRPDTRMPRFYDVNNNSAPADQDKVHAEVHAMTHYLFANSTPPADFVEPPAGGDPAKGKALFLEKGCMACHAHKDYAPETFDPAVREIASKYAKADHGPNLSNVAAKFPTGPQGQKWLANWIHAPDKYHAKSLMPNLQLSLKDANDIAAWIMSVKGEWPTPVDVPAVDSPEVKRGLDDLVELYLGKARVYKKKTLLLREVEPFVATLSQDEKLMYLGERTISRLGCFGCHNISGFETAKPIGTPLNGWGIKSPTKLDFGHITEYLSDQPEVERRDAHGHAVKVRDGTDPFYQDKLAEQTRMGFLYQKLHRPRSYDHKKTKEDLKSWDDRLRMPQFAWADDEKAVEEVMTFVLGLTGEKIAAKYLPDSRYDPSQFAKARGERLVERYNCKGCHVFEMPKFTVPAGTKIADAMPDSQVNLEVSYSDRAKDYQAFYPWMTFDPDVQPKFQPDVNRPDVTIEGMPTATIEEEDDAGKLVRKTSVQLWKPATILGYTFNVGDKLTIIPDKVTKVEADGGDFAWLYASTQAAQTGSDFAAYWNRLPPPLIREGLRVQTPWLTAFLQDPYEIRPAAQLRMPRFHYGSVTEERGEAAATADPAGPLLASASKSRRAAQEETSVIANYFAARDGAEFPYQDIPQRDRAYLSSRQSEHPEYLAGGWSIITKGLCVQCHAIGQYKPTGGADVVNGPDLRQVSGRFRPDFLAEWLGNPARLLPYTAMPQNVPPRPAPGSPPTPGVPKSFEGQPLDQVIAMRDTLLNYVMAIEGQLAVGAPAAAPAEAPKPGTSGGQQ